MKSTRQKFRPSTHASSVIDDCAKYLSPEDQELSKWHESYISNHKLRIATDLDIITINAPSGSRVLELGSIPLVLTIALAKLKFDVTGCDIAPERYASTIQRAQINVAKCDVETEPLPFADNSFDVVIFNELFEHLRINPIFTLSQVLRVAKPGGTLILSSPNLRSLGGIINFLFKNKGYSCTGDIYTQYEKLEKIGHMGHVREYTTSEVIEFLEKIGFRVNQLIYTGKYKKKISNKILSLLPSLSPFVSYIATKPVAQSQKA